MINFCYFDKKILLNSFSFKLSKTINVILENLFTGLIFF